MDNKEKLSINLALQKINTFCNRDKRYCNKKIMTPKPVPFFDKVFAHPHFND